MMIRTRKQWMWLVALLTVLLSSASSRAQSWEDEMLVPHMSSADFEAALSYMALADAEADAARRAFADYLAAFTREAAAIQQGTKAISEEAEASGDDHWSLAIQEQWGIVVFEWEQAYLQFEQRLEGDVVAVLADDAARTRWRSAVRDQRRIRGIRRLQKWFRQRYAIDLIAALNAIDLSDAEHHQVAETVEAYAVTLDTYLHRLEHETVRLSREMRRYGDDPESRKARIAATEEWAALLKESSKPSAEFAPRIADLLEPAHRDAFLEAIDRATYPEAFHKCPAEQALEAIRLAPDIADDKRAAIESLYADYVLQRDPIRRQIIAIVRRWEKGEYPLNREMEEFGKSAKGVPAVEWHEQRTELLRQHPANPLLQRRHDLAIDTVRQMRSVFSDDELARLPLAARLCLTAW